MMATLWPDGGGWRTLLCGALFSVSYITLGGWWGIWPALCLMGGFFFNHACGYYRGKIDGGNEIHQMHMNYITNGRFADGDDVPMSEM